MMRNKILKENGVNRHFTSKPSLLLILGLFICSLFFIDTAAYGQEKEKEDDVFHLGQVMVTATKTKQTLNDIPQVAEVITKEDIEEKKFKTIQDALKYLTGIKISKSSGSWGDKGKVQMLGLDEKHTLVLVDGQRILGGHGDAADLQQVSIEMVERIEVVKGPASTLYGSDAVGGVINIITKSAPAKPTASLSTSFGSHNTQNHEVGAGFSKNKFGSFLNYTYRKSDGVEEETDQYQESILQGTFSYDFTSRSKLTLKPFYSEQHMEEDERKQRRLGFNTYWEWEPDALSQLKLRSSLMTYKHWTEDKSSDWDTNLYEVELNYTRLMFKKHNITAGFHFHQEDIDDRGKEYEADQSLYSFFLQDEINLKSLTLLLGTRLDDHDRWGNEANFNAGILYKVSRNFKLRGSIGTAFKGPSLAKLYADGWKMGPYTMHSNPDLKPEDSLGFQLGMEYLFSEKLLARVSFFRNDVDNLVASRIIGRNIYWENVDEAMTQGFEIDLSTQILDTLNAKLGYTFLNTEDKTTGNELTYKPKHRLSLEIGYQLPAIGLFMNLEGEYIGKRYEDEENTVLLKDYSIFNVVVTKEIGTVFQLFIRVDNIFDQKDIADEYDISGTALMGGLKATF
jgi:outer membrane receptor for ferrienterochelin and colicins